LRCFFESTFGFLVIEAVQQRDSLIEVFLCLFAAGMNGMMLPADRC
jgi:hypothetical protein